MKPIYTSKIAIVIVNWNKKDYVINLLRSIHNPEYRNYEIIVVDNSSTDNSVQEIKTNFPNVTLIENSENLGGTGGFNTGLKYAKGKNIYDFIWLLDNDVEVTKNTLNELLSAICQDEKIGIAGSRIIDFHKREITIEAGSNFRIDTIGVEPLYRNIKNLKTNSKILQVDYVAICSALIRVDALNNVGFMDERYFIFWDDMDFGLQFKRHGYKVVSALNSIVYHPSFTDKRNPVSDFYYSNRNSLLTYSKHFSPLKRFTIFFKFLRFKCKVLIFLGLTNNKDLMKLGFHGIFDFIKGKWGQNILNRRSNNITKSSSVFPKLVKKIIFLNGGNSEEIFKSLEQIKKIYPQAEYTLLMYDDRLDIFEDHFNKIIPINTKRQYDLLYQIIIFINILFKNYDIGINFSYPSPFSYSLKRSYIFELVPKVFTKDNNNLNNVWKLFISTIAGEILAIILTPIIFITSFKYQSNN